MIGLKGRRIILLIATIFFAIAHFAHGMDKELLSELTLIAEDDTSDLVIVSSDSNSQAVPAAILTGQSSTPITLLVKDGQSAAPKLTSSLFMMKRPMIVLTETEVTDIKVFKGC